MYELCGLIVFLVVIIILSRMKLLNPNILIIILVAFVTSLYIRNELEPFYQGSTVCSRLYMENKNKPLSVLPNIISTSMCRSIIQEAEDYARLYGWTTDRHDNYPTTDNQITSEWNTYNYISSVVHNRVFKEVERLYNVRASELGINEFFVAKYHNAKNQQSKLDAHVDGSEFSFVLALNDDYEGGGTEFVKSKEIVNLNTGDCLIFSGQNRHRGIKVKKGTRYILTGFLNYKSSRYCEEELESKTAREK